MQPFIKPMLCAATLGLAMQPAMAAVTGSIDGASYRLTVNSTTTSFGFEVHRANQVFDSTIGTLGSLQVAETVTAPDSISLFIDRAGGGDLFTNPVLQDLNFGNVNLTIDSLETASGNALPGILNFAVTVGYGDSSSQVLVDQVNLFPTIAGDGSTSQKLYMDFAMFPTLFSSANGGAESLTLDVTFAEPITAVVPVALPLPLLFGAFGMLGLMRRQRR